VVVPYLIQYTGELTGCVDMYASLDAWHGRSRQTDRHSECLVVASRLCMGVSAHVYIRTKGQRSVGLVLVLVSVLMPVRTGIDTAGLYLFDVGILAVDVVSDMSGEAIKRRDREDANRPVVASPRVRTMSGATCDVCIRTMFVFTGGALSWC